MSTKQAIDHLCNALKDKEYRLGWEASIAMAFKDQWDLHGPPDGEVTPKEVHRIANRAAAAFIDQLIGKDMVDAWDAALSELEAQTPIDWKGIKVTKGQETHPLGTLIELLEHERDTAIAELEAHSSEPRLTVEQAVEVTKRWIFSASNTDIDDPEWKDDKWIAASKDLRDRLTKAAQ